MATVAAFSSCRPDPGPDPFVGANQTGPSGWKLYPGEGGNIAVAARHLQPPRGGVVIVRPKVKYAGEQLGE